MYSTGILAYHWRSCTIVRDAKAMPKAQPETPMAHTTRDLSKKKYKGKGREVPKYIACSEMLNILQSP